MVRAVRSSIAEPAAAGAAACDFLAFFNGRGRTCDMVDDSSMLGVSFT